MAAMVRLHSTTCPSSIRTWAGWVGGGVFCQGGAQGANEEPSLQLFVGAAPACGAPLGRRPRQFCRSSHPPPGRTLV
jgi:hypothetical protein